MPSEFNETVIAEFRANCGRASGGLADTPIILIHHIGADTRSERVTPLAYSLHPTAASSSRPQTADRRRIPPGTETSKQIRQLRSSSASRR
jgi:hypothetical protein